MYKIYTVSSRLLKLSITKSILFQVIPSMGFPGGTVVKSPPVTNARDAGELGTNPGSGRYPGVENGNPLQYSCLENFFGQRSWLSMGSQKVGHDRAYTYIHMCVCICRYIYIIFFIFFSMMVCHRILNIIPCGIQQDLVIHSFARFRINCLLII